jgi:hypothetical protein
MKAIQAFLETVKQGGKQSHLNMTIIPLLAPDAGEPDYRILEEALAKISILSWGPFFIAWRPSSESSSNRDSFSAAHNIFHHLPLKIGIDNEKGGSLQPFLKSPSLEVHKVVG